MNKYFCWLSGHCCSKFDVQVSSQELAEMIQAGPILRPLTVEHTGDGHTYVIKSMCPWFDDVANKCTIYESRPSVCRTYLCYREKPDDPHREPQEQYEYLQSHEDARTQAKEMRAEGMQYAKDHGWSWLP